jgi:mono/diheme cytochrome c family protein
MGQEITTQAPVPEPASTHWKVGPWRAGFLIVLPMLALLYVVFAARGVHERADHLYLPANYQQDVLVPEPNGAALYAQNCARCHGTRGNADGVTSPALDPWARRFGEEKFQFASTTNGIPTDDDLNYVIAHGIPGTAMPDFGHLSVNERLAIARHVRLLAVSGMYAKLYKKAETDDDPDPSRIHTKTIEQLLPGPVLEVPSDLPAATPESIARGRVLFTKNCATCHGPGGAGDGPDVKGMTLDNGRPSKPRDLARGIFKGGGEPNRLYCRIALGIPGTKMPATVAAFKPSEIGDLVNFVLSLSAKNREAEKVASAH